MPTYHTALEVKESNGDKWIQSVPNSKPDVYFSLKHPKNTKSEFQDTQVYTEKPCLKNNNKNKKTASKQTKKLNYIKHIRSYISFLTKKTKQKVNRCSFRCVFILLMLNTICVHLMVLDAIQTNICLLL